MLVLASLLLLTLLMGLARVYLGPSRGDRLLAVQLLGSAGAAVLLILAHHYQQPALRDVALVLALLAAVLSAALVQIWRRSDIARDDA